MADIDDNSFTRTGSDLALLLVFVTINSNVAKPHLSHRFAFCTQHTSDTAVPCAKLQNHWTTQIHVTSWRDFPIFELRISFRDISYIEKAQAALHRLKYIIPQDVVAKYSYEALSHEKEILLYLHSLVCRNFEIQKSNLSEKTQWFEIVS